MCSLRPETGRLVWHDSPESVIKEARRCDGDGDGDGDDGVRSNSKVSGLETLSC